MFTVYMYFDYTDVILHTVMFFFNMYYICGVFQYMWNVCIVVCVFYSLYSIRVPIMPCNGFIVSPELPFGDLNDTDLT